MDKDLKIKLFEQEIENFKRSLEFRDKMYEMLIDNLKRLHKYEIELQKLGVDING